MELSPIPNESARRNGRIVLAIAATYFLSMLAAGHLISTASGADDRPPPLKDRSAEIEQVLGSVLGDEFAEADVRLTRHTSSRAGDRKAERRDWRYEGWYRTKKSRSRVAVIVPKDDASVIEELCRTASIIRTAGGVHSYALLVREFERHFGPDALFSPVAYADTLTDESCSDKRHASVPRRVRNSYGTFDPRYVFFHQPPDTSAPVAVFGWDDDRAQWFMPGGRDAVAVFANIALHHGCDVAEERWYAARMRLPKTIVIDP